jgi:eukaryotic-like serine/threonine-protein kinase
MSEPILCPHGHPTAAAGPPCPRCGSRQPQEPIPLPTPARWPAIPGYEIEHELGRGGMGVVYKARQVPLGRSVALKVILTSSHAGAAERERFRKEAADIARLQHPNIVQIYEVGEHEELPFFSLEFCPGGSLADHLDGTPLTPLPAGRLIETLARAIHACHERHIIHRDLKPANVLLAGLDSVSKQPGVPAGDESPGKAAERHEVLSGFTPKISDFGLAKDLESSAHTASGAIVGTPSYMAPEQAGGKSKQVGPAADVYALGAILYELLTGRPPFLAATPMDTVLQVLGNDPVPPRQLQPKTPPDLERICLKCLEKEPGKRYATALDLAEDLGRLQRGEPVKARPLSWRGRAWRWCRRNPAVATLMAVVAVTLLAGTATAMGFALQAAARASDLAIAEGKANQKADEEKQAREAAQKAQAAADTARRLADEQRVRAEWLAYAGQIAFAQREWQDNNVAHAFELLDACQWNVRGWEHRYLYTVFTSNQRTLRGHTGPVHGVSFSPDGKRLASAGHYQDGNSWKGELKVWDVERGQQVLSLTDHAGPVHSLCFSPDGKHLASAGGDDTVRIWDVERGQEVLSLKGHTGLDHSICFSPDGKRLASATHKEVMVWDVERGQQVLSLPDLTGWVFSVNFSPDGKRLASSTGGLDTQGKPLAGEVKVWDAQQGTDLLTLKGHTSAVWSISFSPDGSRIASGSSDGTVKLWDAKTGEQVLTLQGHTGAVLCVSFSPDGKRLASASHDQIVKVWDLAAAEQQAAAPAQK